MSAAQQFKLTQGEDQSYPSYFDDDTAPAAYMGEQTGDVSADGSYGDTEQWISYQSSGRAHGRPSDAEIDKARKLQKSKLPTKSDDTDGQPSAIGRARAHGRPSDAEIEEAKKLQQQSSGARAHGRPSDAEIEEAKRTQRAKRAYMIRFGNGSTSTSDGDKVVDGKQQQQQQQESAHGRPSEDKLWNSASNDDDVSDKDYLLRYFPGAESVYGYDENGNILSVSNDAERKTIKRAVCGHWYFFTFGCVSSETKAKSLSEKLSKIKPYLDFTSQLKNKFEWLK